MIIGIKYSQLQCLNLALLLLHAIYVIKVLPPDVLTRISSYVEEVVAFTEKIIANGYA